MLHFLWLLLLSVFAASSLQPIAPMFQVELNQPLDASCVQYFDHCQAGEQLDLSALDLTALGTQQVVIRRGFTKQRLTFDMIDTVAPIFAFIDQMYYLVDGFVPRQMIASIEDESETFLSYDHPKLVPGKHTICITATDSGNNQSTLCNDVILVRMEDSFVFPYLQPTLAATIQQYLNNHRISSSSIGIALFDLTTKEAVSFNLLKPFVAASSIKLPLAIVLYDYINQGILALDDVFPYQEKHNEDGLLLGKQQAYGTLFSLEELLESAIVRSDNNAAQMLFDILRFYGNIQTIFGEFFGTSDFVYRNNQVPPAFLLDVLLHLEEHQEEYPALLSSLLLAKPDQYLQAYVREIPVYHKYGQYQGAVNDIGLMMGEHPYALVVMSDGLNHAEEHIGRLNQIVYEHFVLSEILAW